MNISNVSNTLLSSNSKGDSVFALSSVKFSGGKTTEGRVEGNDKGSTSIKVQKNGVDGLIQKLQDQIKMIKENDQYDSETKQAKIKAITEQIDEIQQAQRQKELDEIQKTLKGEDDKKKKEKNQFAKEEENGVYCAVSEEGLRALITIDHEKENTRKLTEAKGRAVMDKLSQNIGIVFSGDTEAMAELNDEIDSVEASFDEKIYQSYSIMQEESKKINDGHKQDDKAEEIEKTGTEEGTTSEMTVSENEAVSGTERLTENSNQNETTEKRAIQ